MNLSFMLPLPYIKPNLLDDSELLGCQCPHRRLGPLILCFLLGESQRVRAAVIIVPMCQDDVSTLMNIPDDVGILRALVWKSASISRRETGGWKQTSPLISLSNQPWW